MAAPVPLYPYKSLLPAPIYWLYRGMRTLGVAFCFACFWSGAVLVGCLWFPVLGLWPGSRAEKMRRSLRTVRRGFRLFHFVMRVLRLYHRTSPYATARPSGAPADGPDLRPAVSAAEGRRGSIDGRDLRPAVSAAEGRRGSIDSPVVLVANHPTLCDVTSIVSLFPNVVAVARPSFANNALLRRAVLASGFVPTGIHMMKDCEERLRMGFDVLVFPEGTRSPVGSLQPFRRGAFELAARAKVPVVLLKLTCKPSALSKRLPIWKFADRMAVLTIEPFDTIDPASSGLGSRETCRAIEQRYRDVLGYSAPTGAASELQPVGDVQ